MVNIFKTKIKKFNTDTDIDTEFNQIVSMQMGGQLFRFFSIEFLILIFMGVCMCHILQWRILAPKNYPEPCPCIITSIWYIPLLKFNWFICAFQNRLSWKKTATKKPFLNRFWNILKGWNISSANKNIYFFSAYFHDKMEKISF